jgi:uncharacterized protein YbgA (DUF1722 family)/uncharacterized protein YbbK (DUF523 family)
MNRNSEPAPPSPAESADTLRIGISSCLLGNEVRYDGAHKHDRYITGTLGPYCEFVPVCPEVEVGMGIPRESVRLVRDGDSLRMVGVKSGIDHSQAMLAWARARVHKLGAMKLDGFLLKKGSPSCGMERVRVYTAKGMPTASERGLFADELLRHLPMMPVEEEGRLNDAALRENFIVRLFAWRRVRRLFEGRWKMRDLVAFHSREKLLVLAHSPKAEKELGRLVAVAASMPRGDVARAYSEAYMQALSRPAGRRRHVNVLQHMLGHLRTLAGPEARAELAASIEDYRNELVPLVVPVTLLRHYVKLHVVTYLAGQSYLEPHPRELALRNHV